MKTAKELLQAYVNGNARKRLRCLQRKGRWNCPILPILAWNLAMKDRKRSGPSYPSCTIRCIRASSSST